MTFRLEIQLGNDAMQTRRDVAAALKVVALRLVNGANEGEVMDPNGNSVGQFAFLKD